MLDPARSYDLIGDVHGCAQTLEHLLDTLGYRFQAGVWRHPERIAVFLGDIRGSEGTYEPRSLHADAAKSVAASTIAEGLLRGESIEGLRRWGQWGKPGEAIDIPTP